MCIWNFWRGSLSHKFYLNFKLNRYVKKRFLEKFNLHFNYKMRNVMRRIFFFFHVWTSWAPLKPGMVCSNVLHQKSQLMTSSNG